MQKQNLTYDWLKINRGGSIQTNLVIKDFLLPSYGFLLLYPTFWLVTFIPLNFSFWGPALHFSQTSQQQALDSHCFIQTMNFRKWKVVDLREQLLNFPLSKRAVLQSGCSYQKVLVLCFQPAQWNEDHYMKDHSYHFSIAHFTLKPPHQKSPFQPSSVSKHQNNQDKSPMLWCRKDNLQKEINSLKKH